MAKSSFCDSGEITEVIYQVGTFNNEARKKFMRAPFSLLKLNNDEYIMPQSAGTSALDLNNILGSDSYDVEQMLSRGDFGFRTAHNVIIGEHELGNFNLPNWVGVHRFGVI